MFESYFEGLKERVLAHGWKMEGIIVGLTLGTVVLYVLGGYLNLSKFQKWIDYQSSALKEQFAQVGVTRSKLFYQDDDQHYTSYASGRINVAQLILNVTLQSRQNFSLWIMEHLFGFFFDSLDPIEDEVEMVATLHDDVKVEPFIWAVVNKENMNKSRTENYFLSLTKTSDSDKLPDNFVFMTENAALSEVLFDEELRAILDNLGDLVQYVAFTDQQAVHPTSEQQTVPKFRAVVKLNLKTDATSLATAKDLTNKVLERIDYVCSKKFKLRPEVAKKVAKVREAELTKLRKFIEQDKKEQLEEKKLEKLREKKEKLKSDPKELEKLERKQREKQQRKLMKKQRVRG